MLTLGTVPYLNALPLYASLETRSNVRLVRAVPSVLAPMLQRGECEAALIPVIEHLRGVGGGIIGDAGVGADGPVRSVLLFHRAPIETLQAVAVDASSRTSVALLRVILHDGYNISPRFIENAPDLTVMLERHSAALLIGDPALEASQEVPQGVEVLDLGAAWKELTGLPFVFAAWVSRRDLEPQRSDELAHVLNAARDEGVQHIVQLARETTLTPNVSVSARESYLHDTIRYHLDAGFQAGLREFETRARQLELI